MSNTVPCHRVTAISTNHKLSPARTLRTNGRPGLEAVWRCGPGGDTGDKSHWTRRPAEREAAASWSPSSQFHI